MLSWLLSRYPLFVRYTVIWVYWDIVMRYDLEAGLYAFPRFISGRFSCGLFCIAVVNDFVGEPDAESGLRHHR